ncbi:MAG: hypothetical protein JWN30_1088, partial [Bacilli bacterium]|nr:hypothetical protein [Bacilli bacterium]
EHAGTLANTEYYRRILLGARDAHLLCHGSFHRQNILLEGDRVSLVDFAHLHQGIPTEDLGCLLSRYLPRYDWDFQVGKALIDSYTEIRELTRLDLHGLALYLCFPVRPLAIIQYYFEQSRSWEVERFCIEFQKALIDEEGREEFVQFLIDKYALDLAAPDFAYELQVDGGEDELDDFESSSFQAGFFQGLDWSTDVNQALAQAERAVSAAQRSEQLSHTMRPDRPDQAPADPTASTIQFHDPQWQTDRH